MPPAESTCWTLIRGAAAGDDRCREAFVERYAPVVRAYLGARWRTAPLLAELSDAVQQVFLECFRAGGVLGKADAERPGGFRAFFFGMVRNVARMTEKRATRDQVRDLHDPDHAEDVQAPDDSPAQAFDKAWARAVLREAAEHQGERARLLGREAIRRVELLRVRFFDDLPIREIARRWKEDPKLLHHEYARAREEFLESLRAVLRSHDPNDPEASERSWLELQQILDG